MAEPCLTRAGFEGAHGPHGNLHMETELLAKCGDWGFPTTLLCSNFLEHPSISDGTVGNNRTFQRLGNGDVDDLARGE